jgi:hypothetical protein
VLAAVKALPTTDKVHVPPKGVPEDEMDLLASLRIALAGR